MELKKITLILFSTLLAICHTGCEINGGDEPEPNSASKTEYYVSPTPPKGQIVLIFPSAQTYSYLGRGYDVMGDYLNNRSVKSPVIDLNKLPKDEINILISPSSNAKEYEGKNVTEFLQTIKDESPFIVPSQNTNDLLFTGTIQDSEIISDPYDYSTQYAFACTDFYVYHQRQSILIISESKMMPYLSDRFKEDVEELLPEYIIEKYGTHVLREVNVGQRIRSFYRGVITETDEEVTRAARRGLEARRSEIYKLDGENPTNSDKEQSDNYGGAIMVEFHGGDYTALPRPNLLPNELIGGPMDISGWRKSVNENNFALAALPQEGFTPIPIYELIADPVKKQQVK